MVTRTCDMDGNWELTNYGMCLQCPDFMRDLVVNVSLTLSIVSVALLVAALILFSIFDSIQCRRLSIHKNLAMAFVCRFAVFAIWNVVNSTNVFHDCSHFTPVHLWEWEWLCKLILWFVIYFQVASVLWMLIEGAYLYSRFTVFAMRHNDAPWVYYMACGNPVNRGAMLDSRSRLNLFFLLCIVIILVQKLRHENAAESKKIWRTIKATLLLVPLLGISNIPLFIEPQKPSPIYMLGSAILQHSQGIFIAVLYCFLNAEIQQAVRRQLSKIPIEFFK
ncbi:hypothetical protein WR25_07160 isoform C [Diploscapter pachys]|uniref:G-protein coupled receptors family 2 profile 2 domain-containing protein n=1 Tax=Diploscapter pachys TaxID=2018661 RepID=A0A2A2J2B0_9BILA|nr:hypothetical protein WR25_07160 isoform A [Diploscapter pachys]PAV55820.1 hypothetical protein WR25_07160 isoform B [Diploscapter pachys]PAV55821.1 hypothetical protein WR25_07160 isoform C [Diploscapter pachys]